jgi:hypothetical protein
MPLTNPQPAGALHPSWTPMRWCAAAHCLPLNLAALLQQPTCPQMHHAALTGSTSLCQIPMLSPTAAMATHTHTLSSCHACLGAGNHQTTHCLNRSGVSRGCRRLLPQIQPSGPQPSGLRTSGQCRRKQEGAQGAARGFADCKQAGTTPRVLMGTNSQWHKQGTQVRG